MPPLGSIMSLDPLRAFASATSLFAADTMARHFAEWTMMAIHSTSVCRIRIV
jgi:hypothetical protein